MNIDDQLKVRLQAADIQQWHAMILGMTGSGKTNTLYVLAEELARENTKVTIVDPEGDYGGLRGTNALVVGRGRKGNVIDIELTPEKVADAADVLCRYNIPIIILDLSGYELEESDQVVDMYLGRLWRNYSNEDLPPHRIIIDEIQLFAPQSEKTQSKKLLRNLAARGRKRDLTLGIATQSPQSVDKFLLNQTRLRVFHKLATGTALKAVKDLLPGSIDNAGEIVSALHTGEALFMLDNDARRVQIRTSQLFQAKNDKTLISLVQPTFDQSALDNLKELIAVHPDDEQQEGDSQQAHVSVLETERLKLLEKIKLLEKRNQELINENVQLTEELGRVCQQAKQPVVEATNPVEVREQKRERYVEDQRALKHRRNFDRLVLAVQRLSKLDRQVLSFLADNMHHEYSSQELSARLALSPNTIPQHPPVALVHYKMVTRRKGPHGQYFYKSVLYDRIQNEMPTVGYDTVRERIARLAGL